MLDKWFVSAEGREMRGEGRTSSVSGPDVVFKVGCKREGTLKHEAVCTGASCRWIGGDVMSSSEGASWVSAEGVGGESRGGLDGGRGGLCGGGEGSAPQHCPLFKIKLIRLSLFLVCRNSCPQYTLFV